MGRAGQSLKQALEIYGVSQNKLAVALGLERTIINRWVHERADPSAEAVAEITKALKGINSAAAKKFVELYLGELVEDENASAEDEE